MEGPSLIIILSIYITDDIRLKQASDFFLYTLYANNGGGTYVHTDGQTFHINSCAV